jgi:hypothetical protein
MSGAPTLTKEEYEYRKQILDDLKMLVKEEYEEVFRIIKRNGVSFTENSNGVHFDLCLLDEDTLQQIKMFLELCRTQRVNEEERTKEMDSYRVAGSTET